MYSLKDEYEAMFLNSPEKVRAKKKLNELFDKYGENRQDIENGTNNVEYMEYVMASAFADEVLAERRRKRKEQNAQNDDWDEYNPYAPTDVEEEEEEEEIAAEDMPICVQVKKVTEDKELQSKTGQMAVEAYKNLDKEKIRKDTERRADNELYGEIEAEKKRREVIGKRSKIRVQGVTKMLPATKFAEDEEFNKLLGDFEGNHNFPYLDSQNIYTIGEGLNIKNEFYDLPWVDLDGKRITDMNILKREKAKLDKIYLVQEDIKKKYPREKWAIHMRGAKSFEKESILRLPASFLSEVKKQRIKEMEAELQMDINNYNKQYAQKYGRKILDLDVMPREYAQVLFELKYNIGGGNFNPDEFPQLFDGLIRGDREKILKNIHRFEKNSNDKKRNDWAYKLLEGVSKLPSVRVKTQIPDNVA